MGTIANAYGYWEPGPAPAPRRGLFSVAEVVDVADNPHLMLGAEYLTNRCTAGCEWLDLCDPPPGTLKQFMTLNLVQGDAFAVYDALECHPVGVSAEEQESRLRGTFDVKAEAVAEARLQAILMTQAPLASTSLVDMFADLEAELATNYAGLGTLHTDRYTALVARSQNILYDPEDTDVPARTINGTPAVLGRGYKANAGNYWAGAAGRVVVLRGPMIAVATPPLQDAPPRVLVEQQMVILAECVARYTEAPVV